MQALTDEQEGGPTLRFRARGLLQIAHRLMTCGQSVSCNFAGTARSRTTSRAAGAAAPPGRPGGAAIGLRLAGASDGEIF